MYSPNFVEVTAGQDVHIKSVSFLKTLNSDLYKTVISVYLSCETLL